MKRFSALLAVALLLLACTEYTTEAPPPVAAADAGGADVDAPLPGNLLPADRSGFENGTCESGYQAATSAEPTAHSGAWSCRACRNVGNDLYSVYGYSGRIEAGVRYRGRAWVRSVPGATSLLKAAIAIKSENAGDDKIAIENSEGITLTETWQEISVAAVVPAGARSIELYVFSSPDSKEAQPCFLVDDFSLERIE